MQWGESLRFAWFALSHDKVKAALTMLGVVIGSAAIVLVVTIASVGKSYIVNQVESIGANLAYASLDRTGPVVPEDELSRADLKAASQLPSATAAAGTYDMPTDFVAGGKVILARLVGVTEDFQNIRKLRITGGRYFDAVDFSSRDHVCLITDRIAQTVYKGGTAALGNTIKLGEFRCIVIGTFTESVPTFGQSEIQERTVLVPFPLIKVIDGDDYFQVIYLQASSSAAVPSLTRKFAELLRQRHRHEAKYSVDNLSSLLLSAERISLALTIVLLGVALVTLGVAGVGIMNIMLVNVEQRIREIGIRMAIGARQSDIRLQFLLEALFISLVGALLGVGLALLLIGSVSAAGLAPVGVSWFGVVLTIIVSGGTGVLFGYEPASRAASLDPAEALRAE